MTLFARRPLSIAALAASLTTLSLAQSAAADTSTTPADSSQPAAPAPDTDVSPSPKAPAPPPGNAAMTLPAQLDTPIVGPIEHLGPDAYPSTPIRGIDGGSLASIFHGLQWPYYPKTGIGISGYAWIDTGYEHLRRTSDDPQDLSLTYQLQQGRFLLRVTPTWSDGKWFAQAQGEFVANRDQTQTQPVQADTDDMWIKAGLWKSFDVQLGRYEAWEIYHFGLGMDLYTLERQGATDFHFPTIAQIYGVTTMFYRPAGIGAGAIHLYPTDWLRFEIGTQFGNESGDNGIGVRPVAIADFGWLKLKAGAEWKQITPLTDNAKGEQWNYGAGGAVQVVVDPYLEFGVNYAYGAQIQYSFSDGNRSPQGCFSQYSVGGFANARVVKGLLVGAGVNYTYLVDQFYDPSLGRYEDFDQWQGFAAVQYNLFKNFYLKFVGGYALENLNPITTDQYPEVHNNIMLSGRLRAQYVF